jgi:hypothetical protein
MSNSTTDQPQQCCTFHAWGISHFTKINNLDNTHIVFVINAQGFGANICTEKNSMIKHQSNWEAIFVYVFFPTPEIH